jgi:hypothetical protein
VRVRIGISGYPTTTELAESLRQLLARLESIGVNFLSGVNISMDAYLESEQLVLLNEAGSIVDSLVIRGEQSCPVEPQPSWAGPDPLNAKMVRKTDIKRIEMLRSFSESTDLPEKIQCELLGVGEERLRDLMRKWTSLELTSSERSNLNILGRMLEAAESIFPDGGSMIEWFLGPFPHSKLAGESAFGQICRGGIEGVLEIATALERMVVLKQLGLPVQVPPPGYYDLVYPPRERLPRIHRRKAPKDTP